MKTYLLLLFNMIMIQAIGQYNIKSTNLSDSGNVIKNDYIKRLDTIFSNSKIIGLGESTHGTSEFSIIRIQIFKYLVYNHNYTTFFLEADYGACARINRYVKGENDNPELALLEVKLWPWQTKELLGLIIWMREYNEKNNNILDFIGCDMQLITDDEIEMKRFLSSNPKYSQCLKKLPSLKFDTNDTLLLRLKKKEWEEFSNFYFNQFPQNGRLRFKTVNQWFENELYNGFKLNFRDSCMGNNIADYLQDNPGAKGIYFAHNGHVSKLKKRYLSDTLYFKRAGQFLFERINREYYAIALDFNKGSFNAVNFKNKNFVMEQFEFKRSKNNTISKIVLKKDDCIKFVKAEYLPNINLKMNSIGAVYGKNKSGHKTHRFRKIEKDLFDGYIIINYGNPSELLLIKSTKNKG